MHSQDLDQWLSNNKSAWLVTGAAGFIGSNLCIALIKAGQTVVALDNFATGHQHNITDIQSVASALPGSNFRFIDGDITDFNTCLAACAGVGIVLHQAALGSVPRSIATPLASHSANVDGFINMLQAATQSGIKRFVYASSSSVYGDSAELPKVETRTGAVLSPYAATKAINEVYAGVFQRNYGISCFGLRYFNVFGPRQDPNGPYAAVIPKWTAALIAGEPLVVNGDGSTSRDFCFIDNVVQANLRAALLPTPPANAQAFNVAFGGRTTLLDLAQGLKSAIAVAMNQPEASLKSQIEHAPFRAGDVLHSLANIEHIQNTLAYKATDSIAQGLAKTMPWYLKHPERL